MAQQIVPPFNKKEVQAIVNEGISTGEVKIPAGGTKLYLHQLSISGGAPFNAMKVISTQKSALSTNITSNTEANKFIQSIVSIPDYFIINNSVAYGKTVRWDWSTSKIQLTFMPISDPTQESQGGAYYGEGSSDTVTEL